MLKRLYLQYFRIYYNGEIRNATIQNSMMTALLKFSFIHWEYEDISRLEVVVLGFLYHPLENLVNVLQHRILLINS